MPKPIPISELRSQAATPSGTQGKPIPISALRAGATGQQPSGHGGILGTLEHVATQTGADLYSTARHAPGGLYAVGKALVQDEGNLLRGKQANATTDIAIQSGKQTVQDLKHPLRRPGNTLLDATALISGGAGAVARGAEAGKVIRAADGASAAEKAGKAAKALVTKPKPGTRAFTHDNVTVNLPASRNALIRASQRKVLDPLRHAFPDAPVIGSAKAVGRQIKRAQMYDKRLADSVASDFVHKSKVAGMMKRAKSGKVSQEALAKQHAMRVVAEGVPIEQRLATHEDYLNRGYSAAAKTDPEVAAMREKNFYQGHNEQLKLNALATKYVHNVKDAEGNLVPQIRPKYKTLVDAYDSAKKLAGDRESLLSQIDKLSEASKRGRYSAPGREFFGMRGPEAAPRILPVRHDAISHYSSVDIPLDEQAALMPNDGQHLYHSTDVESFAQIKQHGLTPGKSRPGEITGVYFGQDWADINSLRPGRKRSGDIILRAQKGNVKTEVTDMYDPGSGFEEHVSRSPVPPSALEFLGADGVWHPLTGSRGDFTLGEMRVPTVPKGKFPRSKGDLPQVGAQRVVNGVPAPIASIYKPYLGKAYKGGAIRNDVVRLMHESWQEAQRYYTLVHVTDRLKSAAKDFKSSDHDILMKVDEIPGQPSMKDARALAEAEHTDPSKLAALAYKYESVRQQMFPDVADGVTKNAPLGELPPPGYKWVDSRLLGGLNERNPLLGFYGNKAAHGTLKVIDAINNASKLSILYLKPAYIAPNLLGNVAMNIVQQGFAAPHNLTRAARLNAAAGAEVVNRVDHLMGEGLTGSLESSSGVSAKAVNFAAHGYSKLVDVVPRRAAFLHEAALEGFKTPEQLKSLVTDQANAEKLHEVTQRANAAIIDYGDLNNFERSIVRRVIFFYPWVKGATKWSVQFVAEHPIQAAAVTRLGEIGKEQQQEAFPFPLPSWAESLIPVGQKNGHPTTINPSGVSVLSTPADMALALSALAHKNPAAASAATGMLTPALSTAGAAFKSGAKQAVADQLQGSPLAAALGLARPSKSFPSERQGMERILLYLLGSGVTPRETNPAQLQKSGYLERHPRK